MVLGLLALVASATAAGAEQKQLAQSGAWRAISATQGNRRLCFAISKPIERQPAGLKRDPGRLFVTLKSGGAGGRTELSIDFGFPLARTGHVAAVDNQGFSLMARGETAWLGSEADEAAIVRAMRAGQQLRVSAHSRRGNATTDVYDLSGFTAAMSELRKKCRP